MDVKIKLVEGGQLPTKGTEGAAAFDCYARESVIVGAKTVLVPLGFCMELPAGYHAEIVPRSSIGLKTPLRMANSVGIIDSDYRAEVHAMYELEGKAPVYYIEAGQRICQMLIKKNVAAKMIVVDELSDTERGENGFGSTGK